MKIYNELSKTAKIMIKWILILFIGFLALGLGINIIFLKKDIYISYSLGLLAGILISIYKVVSIENSLTKSVDLEEKQASSKGTFGFILRYIVTIGVLILTFIYPNIFNPIGTILGILCLQFSAYLAKMSLEKIDNEEV